MKIILLGLPCAGKGVQGYKLAVELGICHVSTGDIARKHVREQTALGRRIEEERKIFGYLTDELAYILVQSALNGLDSWILDGFPRTPEQAESLPGIDLVIYLKISQEISVRRMQLRNRADDLSETPQVRAAKVMERLPLLVDHCEKRWPLLTIDASPPEDDVWQDFLANVRHFAGT